MTGAGTTSSGRRRLGLVGFFGWGNFGDELFLSVHRQFLSEQFEISVLHDLLEKPYYSGQVADAVAAVDAIVIGGGDLIIPWQQSELYWKPEYLERPVFLTGIGVPRWGGYSKDVVDAMRAFVQHPNVRFISTRDAPSQEWIVKHLEPNVAVHTGADMVCALDVPPVERSEERVLGVVTRKRKNEGDDLFWLERLCEKAARLDYRIDHLVLGVGRVGEADEAVHGDLRIPGKKLVRSDDLDELCRAIGRCHGLASMKFHGTVVAAMYGVPSIVLSATDKNRNFMGMIDRPELLSGLGDAHLPDRFSPYMAAIPRHSRTWLRDSATAAMECLRASLLEAVPAPPALARA
jgi:polysaccharide pyruvyl transferase WcaK-like protein